ncbi:hypothetical protein Tco_0327783, partial [Tanacetum coccineum]
DSPFDLEAFSNSDYAGASLDRKSTTGGCQFLGKRLISWQCKKQTIVANATTEADYVAAANCCGQIFSQRLLMLAGLTFSLLALDYLISEALFEGSGPIHLVADETVYKEWEDRMERAATTASSLEAEHDSGNINRTQSMATLNESFPQGTGSGSGPRCQDTILGVQKLKLVDKKKVIITKTSIRSDLKLDDAEGTDCLPTVTIFAELERMGFVQVFLDKQVEGMSKHKRVYVTPSHTKKVFANMKRPCKGFSGRVTPLFSTMIVQAIEDIGEDSAAPSDSHSTPIISQPSSSKPQKKKSRRKQRKDSGPTEPVTDEAHVSTPSYDPPQSGKDSIKLSKLMNLCTNLQEKVLNLVKAKTAQAKKITSLKKRVKQLEKRRKSRPLGLRRLRKGRKIKDLNADAKVNLVNETEEMNDENLMFDTCVLEEQEIEFEKMVESQYKRDKGKGKIVEPEVPLKKKDQVALDEEMARNLKAQLQAEHIEEERLARQKEEEANIALIESWDNT